MIVSSKEEKNVVCVLCPRDMFLFQKGIETIDFINSYKIHLKDVVMILPQVHLRKPCYDFTFL